MLGSVCRNRCQELHPPPCTALRLLASWAPPAARLRTPATEPCRGALPSQPGRDRAYAHLGYVADVHLHIAVLTGPIQPLHVHIQRPGDGERVARALLARPMNPMPDIMLLKAHNCPRFTDEDPEAWQAEPRAQRCWDLDCRAWALSAPWAALPKTATAPPPVAQPSPCTKGVPTRDSCIALDPSRQRSPVHPPGHSGVE